VVDAAVAVLRRQGLENFMVQAGGDLFLAGRRGARDWIVGIQDRARQANQLWPVDGSDSDPQRGLRPPVSAGGCQPAGTGRVRITVLAASRRRHGGDLLVLADQIKGGNAIDPVLLNLVLRETHQNIWPGRPRMEVARGRADRAGNPPLGLAADGPVT